MLKNVKFLEYGALVMLLDGGINNQVSVLFTLGENQEPVIVWFDLVLLYEVFGLVLVVPGNDISP